MDSPHASAQALYDSLTRASGDFVGNVLASLSEGQRLESAEIFKALTASLMHDSGQWAEIQKSYYQRHLELWSKLAHAGEAAETTHAAPVITPGKGDRRFNAPEWQQLPFFDYLKQAYLLNSRWLAEVVEAAHLDAKTKNKLRFFARQLIDAAAPANFPTTNPEVLRLASTTNGESVLRGLEQLSADLKKGRISMSDETAFEVGRNLAVTPGTVVFENELIQLIQYRPATNTVHEWPLLMVPPCINKFYILDLQPENSFVRYSVSQGHTVFMVSWRNVPENMGHITWDEYLENGVIKAIDVAREICGVEQINVLGFCVGGTLLGAALAILRARNRTPAASATLLTTMLDFSDTGDISVFVDEAYVTRREHEFAHGGVLHGKELALTFASLRANELIWNYVVNNYLKGRAPDAFDLLYWNSDSTNLPGAMYAYYVRNLYLENNLRVPRRLTMCGVPVDLSQVKLPTYVLSSRDDHIVPWKTAYQNTRLLGGPHEFVLAASGHIAGVVNPPSSNKRHYWLNPVLHSSAEDWLAGARQQPGSWWSHWSAWLADRSGSRVPARTEPGSAHYRGLEPAPGRYVKERCA